MRVHAGMLYAVYRLVLNVGTCILVLLLVLSGNKLLFWLSGTHRDLVAFDFSHPTVGVVTRDNYGTCRSPCTETMANKPLTRR